MKNIFHSKNQIENRIKVLDEHIIQHGIYENSYRIQKYLKYQLQEMLTRKELFWKHKYREMWLQEVDRNTKFCQASMKMRISSNLITQIRNEDQIDQEAVSLFLTLFTNGVVEDEDIRQKKNTGYSSPCSTTYH